MEKNHNKYELKLLTLGDTSVGKSSFIVKFTEDKFSYNYVATMGLDFKQKVIKLQNGVLVHLRIFDTAGQERFKSISLNFIKKANGILLLYDISNKASFDSVNKWIDSINDVAKEKISIVLVGNKCDLEDERMVTKEEGQKKASELEIPFLESSCKDGINIFEAFEKLSEEVLKKGGHINNDGGERITKEKAKKMKKSGGCCK